MRLSELKTGEKGVIVKVDLDDKKLVVNKAVFDEIAVY